MVDVGLVIGMVLERDATHLLLSDGSAIFSPNELLFAEVSAGSGLAVSYHVSDGRKVAETLTIIPPLKRPGRPERMPQGQQDPGCTTWSIPRQERPRQDKPDTLVCPLCRKPILDLDPVLLSAGARIVVHLRCDNLRRKVAGKNKAEETGQSAKYGPMT